MAKYNVMNVGGEILNLDGALDLSSANQLANEIERESNIEVKIVEIEFSDTVCEEIIEAVNGADLVCPEQVCDMVLAVAECGGDWKAKLQECVNADADEAKSLGVED